MAPAYIIMYQLNNVTTIILGKALKIYPGMSAAVSHPSQGINRTLRLRV